MVQVCSHLLPRHARGTSEEGFCIRCHQNEMEKGLGQLKTRQHHLAFLFRVQQTLCCTIAPKWKNNFVWPEEAIEATHKNRLQKQVPKTGSKNRFQMCASSGFASATKATATTYKKTMKHRLTVAVWYGGWDKRRQHGPKFGLSRASIDLMDMK